jgi:hypothetical protein
MRRISWPAAEPVSFSRRIQVTTHLFWSESTKVVRTVVWLKVMFWRYLLFKNNPSCRELILRVYCDRNVPWCDSWVCAVSPISAVHKFRGNFERWRLMFMGHQYGTWCMSPFCHLESWSGPQIFWNVCSPPAVVAPGYCSALVRAYLGQFFISP